MKTTPILICFFILQISQFVQASSNYILFKPRQIGVNLAIDYFKTDANFDSSGQRQNLLNGSTYQVINFEPKMNYNVSSSLNFDGSFNIAQAESNDTFFNRKNSVVNYFNLGADYLILSDVWYRFLVQISYKHPLRKNDVLADDVLTSDGATEIHPELNLNLDFEGDIYSFIKSGIIFRGEGLSTLATYSLGSEFRFENLGVGAQLSGKLSIKNDEKTDQAFYRESLTGKVNAGSFKYNTVNPNIHTAEALVNFPIAEKGLLKFIFGYNLLGSNSALGYTVGLDFGWKFNLDSNILKKSTRPKNDSIVVDPNFQLDTNDGVNQEYFKPVTPIKQEYIQQIKGSDASEKIEPATETVKIIGQPTIKKESTIKKNNPVNIQLRKKKK